MPAIITDSFRLNNAKIFKDSFSNGFDRYYMFIGRQKPWPSEQVPPLPADTVQQASYELWRDMLAAKAVGSGSISHSIRRYNWTTGTVYDQYDDDDPILNTKKYYVITDQNRVYKCIDNRGGVQSMIKPSGTGTSIISLGDGYRWKFMYELTASEITTFVSPTFVPCKFLESDDGSTQWIVQQAASVTNGTVSNIKVLTGGTNYPPNTSFPVVIEGDGTGATATAFTSAGGSVLFVNVNNAGSGYTRASVLIGSSGTGAVAKASVAPKGGHGANALLELSAVFITMTARFDNTEQGLLTTNNEFRKIGLVKNPLQFSTNQISTAEFIRQYLRMSLTAVTGTFLNDEKITFSNGATADIVEYDVANAYIYFNNLVGILPTTVFSVTGQTSAAVANSNGATIQLPGFAKNTGETLYLEHRRPITRDPDQSEIVLLTVEF